MNTQEKEFIWDLARDHASQIECDNLCRATKIEMTEENLYEFVEHLFFLFRETLSLKLDETASSSYDFGYNQGVADCMAETLVFTGEVE